MRLLVTIVFAVGLTLGGHAQSPAPLFETRGVWFMTSLGDGNWPERGPNDTAEKQAADLRDRVRAAHAQGLNTFAFLVTHQGDALYASARLPWSPIPVGAGQDPGYDPLAVVIEEAHRLGMMVHAWVNVFLVGDSLTAEVFFNKQPSHVLYSHVDWLHQVGERKELWLDPALPEARAWLVDNLAELVSNYDLDAIHLDFARYPLGGLPHDATLFQAAPRGFTDLDDWRRDNVTLFVRDAFDRITARKPWVRLGATPIPNYEPFPDAWPALWAFTDVFQESRAWLTEGHLDYLVPQIYFDFGRDPEPGTNIDSPDFAYLVRDWVATAENRPLYVGMAPFKEIVREEMGVQIDSARAFGAQGQFYFRYDHTAAYDLAPRYPYSALPAAMAHRPAASAPTTPSNLSLSLTDDSLVTLTWNAALGTADDPIRTYVLFRSESAPPSLAEATDLFALAPPESLRFRDTLRTDQPVYYQLAAQSRLGLLSPASNIVASNQGTARETAAAPTQAVDATVFPNPATTHALIQYHLDAASPVSVMVVDLLGREAFRTRSTWQGAGRQQLRLSTGSLAPGVYLLLLTVGQRQQRHTLVVH